MNINEVKTVMSHKTGTQVTTLDFSRQKNEKDEPTEWLQTWDNDNRVRLVAHQDVIEKIKQDRNYSGLAVKYEEIPQDGERKPYRQFVLITPTSIEASF